MFSSSYIEAKSKFVQLAKDAGFTHKKYIMPDKTGPAGEELSTDVAYHITPETTKLLIVNSGIHGVEGFYGSAMQAKWLATHKIADLPKELGVVFIHACNPYGFANIERVDQSEVDECGIRHRVDPNRNFVDFSKPLPINPGYTQAFENMLIPSDWYGWKKHLATAYLFGKYLLDKICHSYSHLHYPMMGGQYWSPTGFSYGGNHPCWTNIVIKKIMDEIVSQHNCDEIAIIDLHTGVGKKYQVEAYSMVSEDNENHSRTKEWMQGIVNTISSPYPISGDFSRAMLEYFPGKKVTSFGVECGTKSPITVVNSLRAQNWLDKYGDSTHSHEQKIKNDIKSAFCPDDNAWKTNVTDITMRILDKTLEKLADKNVVENSRKHKNDRSIFNTVGLLFCPKNIAENKNVACPLTSNNQPHIAATTKCYS